MHCRGLTRSRIFPLNPFPAGEFVLPVLVPHKGVLGKSIRKMASSILLRRLVHRGTEKMLELKHWRMMPHESE